VGKGGRVLQPVGSREGAALAGSVTKLGFDLGGEDEPVEGFTHAPVIAAERDRESGQGLIASREQLADPRCVVVRDVGNRWKGSRGYVHTD
jgi:hypothetical protein